MFGETLQETLGCAMGDPTINVGCAMGDPTIYIGMCHERPYNLHWDVPWETLQSTLGCAIGDPIIYIGMCHGRPYNQHWDVPWETLQETLGFAMGEPTMNRDWDLERRPYNEQTLGPAGETLQ